MTTLAEWKGGVGLDKTQLPKFEPQLLVAEAGVLTSKLGDQTGAREENDLDCRERPFLKKPQNKTTAKAWMEREETLPQAETRA